MNPNAKQAEYRIVEIDQNSLNDPSMPPDWLDAAVSLSNQELGSDYTTLQDLQKMVAYPDTCVQLAVSENNAVVGLAVGEWYSSISECLGYSTPAEIHSTLLDQIADRNVEATEPVGYVRTVVVSPEFQKRGIASSLVMQTLNWFAGKALSRALCVAWTDTAGCHIASTMKRTGFDSLGNFPNFYLEESTRMGYDCTTCGNPCVCSAEVFFQAV